jgi:16S rRNA (cytidine1402-2'-O)-methyltransferase
MPSNEGCLYLIPTPIGNLGDISARALEVLERVDLVACEDTRTSGQLLKHFGLKKKLISYHEFNERSRAGQLLDFLKEGQSVGVITDAGSPGISDPAYRVVKTALENNITVVPLPGPTALIPALTASGLPTDRFFFEGFLPPKSGGRTRRLENVKDFEHTLVFYESPHRVRKSLEAMLAVLGDRPACLAREISKKFEEFIRGNLSDILAQTGKNIKGELVIIVAGKKPEKKKQD